MDLLTYLIGHNKPINGFRPTPVGYINRWQGLLGLVFPTDTRSSSSPTSADKYPSRRSILHQLALDRRSYLGLFSRILSRLQHQCLIVSMPLRHKEARVRWASCRILVLLYERGLYYSIAHWDHSSTCWQEWSCVWSPDWHHFWR